MLGAPSRMALPAEPENRTRGLLLPSSFYDSAFFFFFFFQPGRMSGKNVPGPVSMEASGLLLRLGPEGGAGGGGDTAGQGVGCRPREVPGTWSPGAAG